MIAQRRPSLLPGRRRGEPGALTNSYLRVLADAGVISAGAARRGAADQAASCSAQSPPDEPRSFIDRKAANAVRTKLAGCSACRAPTTSTAST